MPTKLEDLAAFLNDVAKMEGRVGILPEEGRQRKRERWLDEDGEVVERLSPKITVAQAAIYNELGTAKIPARPVYRSTSNHPETRAIIAGMGLQLEGLSEFTETAALAIFREVGERLLKRLGEAIEARTEPANAAFTVEKKGFNDPLINTRQTLQSLSFEIRKSNRRLYKRNVTGA